MVRLDTGSGCYRVAHQPAREREVDVRAHAVGKSGGRPQARRHALRQPPFHPSCWNSDDLRREWIGQGVDEQRAERLDQAVGSFSSVEV
jgi:hypothetical protein